MNQYRYDILALASIYLVIRLHHLPHYMLDPTYDETQVKNCAIHLLNVFQNRAHFHKEIKKKYS